MAGTELSERAERELRLEAERVLEIAQQGHPLAEIELAAERIGSDIVVPEDQWLWDLGVTDSYRGTALSDAIAELRGGR